MRSLPILLLLLFPLKLLLAQDSLATGYVRPDYRKIDLLPALSYAPETSLTLGVIGVYYMDFFRGDTATRLSNAQFLAVYTLANQLALESTWEIFTNGNKWRIRGEAFFDIWPDRNYGRGNTAGALVEETDEDGQTDTLNYLRFNSNRLNFSPVVMRRILPNLYLGIQGDMEWLSRERALPDSWRFLNADSVNITQLPVAGIRVGLGPYLLYDSRDFVLNPLNGSYLEVRTGFFGPVLGSDFRFQNIRLDARHYINTWRNHTLALRGVVNARFSRDPDGIPFRGLSRIGGHDFLRGYFRGTFQDNHLLATEVEYRLPFWKEDGDSPFWKIWKRLGLAVFGGAAQVSNDWNRFALNDFNLTAGAGLRVLFNRDSRVTIRIDYAFGLRANSDGPGQRQSGFYFYLAEAF